MNPVRMWVESLTSLSRLRIQRCHELWCRSQMQLGSGGTVAVVQAGSCSSDLTFSLGTSMYHESVLKDDRRLLGELEEHQLCVMCNSRERNGNYRTWSVHPSIHHPPLILQRMPTACQGMFQLSKRQFSAGGPYPFPHKICV